MRGYLWKYSDGSTQTSFSPAPFYLLGRTANLSPGLYRVQESRDTGQWHLGRPVQRTALAEAERLERLAERADLSRPSGLRSREENDRLALWLRNLAQKLACRQAAYC